MRVEALVVEVAGYAPVPKGALWVNHFASGSWLKVGCLMKVWNHSHFPKFQDVLGDN
jgi:hypothetical protein